MKNKQEAEALKKFKKFEAQYLKLLSKFPEVTLSGDTNGNIRSTMYFGEGGVKFLQSRLPSFVTESPAVFDFKVKSK